MLRRDNRRWEKRRQDRHWYGKGKEAAIGSETLVDLEVGQAQGEFGSVNRSRPHSKEGLKNGALNFRFTILENLDG